MFSGLRHIFSFSARELEVQRIVEMRMKQYEAIVNGDATDADRKSFRLGAEYEARREISQRASIDLLMLGGLALGAESLVLHFLA